MGNNKRKPPAAVAGGPKERHKRAQRHGNGSLSPQPPPGLDAKRPLPKPRDKHYSYFEFVENKDKKKKLECANIATSIPPQGYSFIPLGHPELTKLCKELSREQGVKIYIVSNCNPTGAQSFANQMSRMGFHFSSSIVDKARETLSLDTRSYPISGPSRRPEPIPASQEEYHAQVDAVLRDLFPRIPHTDRQIIIDHAFTRRVRYKGGEPPVGLSRDMTLARRVQLAVLAHIRHSHTRYDELLRTGAWHDARKQVQSTCLDVLVKWRGDEETGRDQLEEILREVVVISDSEDEESADEEPPEFKPAMSAEPQQLESITLPTPEVPAPNASLPTAQPSDGVRATERVQRRGFKRYAAVQQAWDAARLRHQRDQKPPQGAPASEDMPNVTTSVNSHEHRAPMSFSLPGRAPSSNGYVPHIVSQDIPANREQAPYPEVHFAARQPTLGSSAPHAPRGDSLRDLVVPSIESSGYPAPGASSRGEDRFVFPSIQRGMGPFNGPVSTPVIHDGQYGFIPGTRSVVDRLGYQRTSPLGYHSDGVVHQMPGHDQGVHGNERRAEQSMPYPRPYDTPRIDGDMQSPGRLAPDRIVVNAAAPGNRSNPIVMEDRGGFYERVPVPEPAGMPSRQVTGVPARHRVVSGEEGSRILQETQGTPGVEIIPLSRPGNAAQPMYPSNGSVMDRASGNPWESAPQSAHGGPGYVEGNHGYALQPGTPSFPPPPPHYYQGESRTEVLHSQQPFPVPFEGESLYYQESRPPRSRYGHFGPGHQTRTTHPDEVYPLR